MRSLVIVLSLGLVFSAPQGYSDEPAADLSDDTYATIAEVFGTNEKQVDAGGYSTNNADLTGDNNVDVLVQVIKDANNLYPNDYQTPDTAQLNQETKATVEVDTVHENCADYTEQFGYMCVPYYQCSNGTIITDGAGLIDIRNGFGALTPEDSKCPGFLDVCCKDPDFIPPPPPPIVKYAPKCGRRNQAGLGARIQGFTESESQFGEWPHMCAVLHAKPVEQEPGYSGEPETVNLYQCGGSLIAPGVILTAAHCVDKFRQNPTELKIRCGEWDTQHQSEPYPHQDRDVQNLAIHPEFDGRNLQNDFAVLFVTEDFVLDQHLDTACLPAADEVFDGETCFATGWGKDQFGAVGQYQVVLKEIDLPVVGHDQCQDSLRTTRLGQKFKLHDSFLCAGGVAGKDTCKGDGGSPLVCPSKYDPDTYVQAGIVAWGIGCGETGTPGVYADVSKATCWIDQAISCQYGATTGVYNSYFGYTTNVCQEWMDNKIAGLEQKRDAAGKYGKIFEAMIGEYNKCSVMWEQPSEPLISDLERDTVDASYAVDDEEASDKLQEGSYDQVSEEPKNADHVDPYVDPSTNEKQEVDPYVETSEQQEVDPNYSNTNEKQVDPQPVTCGAPAYTNDNADLTKDTQEEAADDIAEVADPY